MSTHARQSAMVKVIGQCPRERPGTPDVAGKSHTEDMGKAISATIQRVAGLRRIQRS